MMSKDLTIANESESDEFERDNFMGAREGRRGDDVMVTMEISACKIK